MKPLYVTGTFIKALLPCIQTSKRSKVQCKEENLMFNAFLIKKKQEVSIKNELQSQSGQKKGANKKQILASNVEDRRQKWLEKVQSEDNFKKQYYYGAQEFTQQPHKFREEQPQKFFGRRNILAYTQTTSKERCETAQEKYKNSFLETESFNQFDPNRHHEKWLRDRQKFEESSINFKYNTKNEIDRVIQEKSLNQYKIDFTPLNTKELNFPIYRQHQPEQWSDSKNFQGMTGGKDKGWEKISLIDKQKQEPFFPKFKSVKDFSRIREKCKEMSDIEFNQFSHQDNIWSVRMTTSNSIRSYNTIKGSIKNVGQQTESFNPTASTSSIGFHMRKTQSQKALRESSRQVTPQQKILIDQGDVGAVQDVMNTIKDLTATSPLYYIPNQDSKITFNAKYKLNKQTINDKYLMNIIDGAKQKTYYKSAETKFIFDPSLKSQTPAPQSKNIITPLYDQDFDVGKLILNDKMKTLSQIDQSNSRDNSIEKPSNSNQQQNCIQEELNEGSDGDSPRIKAYVNNQTPMPSSSNNLNNQKGSPHTNSLLGSPNRNKKPILIPASMNSEVKQQRKTQLKQVMNGYFERKDSNYSPNNRKLNSFRSISLQSLK